MIFFVTSAEHRYTHESVVAESETNFQVISYDDLLGGNPVERGTYILTDFDRLPSWQLYRAAKFYRWHRAQGGRTLNDPAAWLTRQALLRRLNRAGINDFDAYRAEEGASPKRWPVFLRMEGNHGSPVTKLVEDAKALARAIPQCLVKSYPISTLLVIEYAAEPVRPGLYRKLSMFRVGEKLLGYTCVHDDQWVVKQGKPGIAPAELYEEEFTFVRDHSFAEAMWPVFKLAGIEYGRVDFGIVNGRPQVYEINTNPELKLVPPPGEVPRREESNALFRLNYLEALKALDS